MFSKCVNHVAMAFISSGQSVQGRAGSTGQAKGRDRPRGGKGQGAGNQRGGKAGRGRRLVPPCGDTPRPEVP
jgi:hypothetical protein